MRKARFLISGVIQGLLSLLCVYAIFNRELFPLSDNSVASFAYAIGALFLAWSAGDKIRAVRQMNRQMKKTPE